MSPPLQNLPLDIKALSGILGSVSIACWVVVFSPQIVENFKRQSAEGLSVVFIAAWLLGDVFNILGAVLQGVLPTMIILAIYYTFADLVLLAQCFYYEGFTLKDKVSKPTSSTNNGPVEPTSRPSERTALLSPPGPDRNAPLTPSNTTDRRSSFGSFRERLLSVDATHLSPATPLVDEGEEQRRPPPPPVSAGHGIMFNVFAVLLVCAAGVLGWWLGNQGQDPISKHPKQKEEPLEFNWWGQVFGYICALLYLGSRIPQLLLNYRRKSTEGISMLFFLFACIGNLTYVLSIMAYEPVCERPRHCAAGETGKAYWKYFLVNLSWLVGSAGTLVLDGGVFVQYFMYKKEEGWSSSDEEDVLVNRGAEERVVSRRERGRREVSFEGGD